jgi:hypothetical protein
VTFIRAEGLDISAEAAKQEFTQARNAIAAILALQQAAAA